MSLTAAALFTIVWFLIMGWCLHTLMRKFLRMGAQLEGALAMVHLTSVQLARLQDQVREGERQRIARDIHDDLGQHLLALKIDLSLLQVSAAGANPRLHQRATGMLSDLDHTISSLRAIINDLHPLALENGLRAALEWQLGEFTRKYGISHSFKADAAVFDSPPVPERDAMLFRIVQEALSNIVRHAHATDVQVSLRCDGRMISLRVQDNGIGMVAPAPAQRRGCGLPGIRARVQALGGRLAIDSVPDSGTVLSLIIPMPVATQGN